MDSDKTWVHKPDSALNKSTKSVLAIMVGIIAVLIIGALLFLKGKFSV